MYLVTASKKVTRHQGIRGAIREMIKIVTDGEGAENVKLHKSVPIKLFLICKMAENKKGQESSAKKSDASQIKKGEAGENIVL